MDLPRNQFDKWWVNSVSCSSCFIFLNFFLEIDEQEYRDQKVQTNLTETETTGKVSLSLSKQNFVAENNPAFETYCSELDETYCSDEITNVFNSKKILTNVKEEQKSKDNEDKRIFGKTLTFT